MNLQSIAESLRTALFQSRQSAAELKSKLAELKAERSHIAGAALVREDVEALLLASLQRQCDEALADPGILRELTDLQGQGRYLIDMQTHPACTPLTPEINNTASASLLAKIMALLSEPESILARMKPALDRLDWDKCGLPLTRRRAKVEKLDAEITRLELELSGIESAIAGATDVAPAVPSGEPVYGARRQIDGSWATWAAVYPGAKPGWVYDQ